MFIMESKDNIFHKIEVIGVWEQIFRPLNTISPNSFFLLFFLYLLKLDQNSSKNLNFLTFKSCMKSIVIIVIIVTKFLYFLK